MPSNLSGLAPIDADSALNTPSLSAARRMADAAERIEETIRRDVGPRV